VLGRRLAALHRSSPPSFGLEHDNFIGVLLPQANAALPTWAEFYRERRLEPQLNASRGSRRVELRDPPRLRAVIRAPC
jgi:fructosamine-3-kinase